MAITISPLPGVLTSVEIFTNFSETITASSATATISSVNISFSSSEPGITSSNGSSSCTISGQFSFVSFPGSVVTYVNKGSSDKIQTAVTLPINDCPDEKDVFEVIPDSNLTKTLNVEVTVISSEGTSTYDYTIIAIQTYTFFKDWIEDYQQNRYT